MAIVRREHRAQFTIVPNAIFLDDRLSVEAKGVLGYLLSRPHRWHVRLDHVGRTLRIGRKKLQRIFRELIGAGYVIREQPADYRCAPFPRNRLRCSRRAIGAVPASGHAAWSAGRKGTCGAAGPKGPRI
jgi:hypothetical protein